MEGINKREKSPETLWLTENRQQSTKPGKFQFKFDSNLNRKLWVSGQPDRKRKIEVAAIDLELLFRNNKKNSWGRGHFEVNEPRTSWSKTKTISKMFRLPRRAKC